MLVFQRGVVELFSRSVFDLCCKEDCHLLEVIGQLLSSNNILEFLNTVLQVIGIRSSVFIMLPEQLSASNESDCILKKFCLDFWLVRVLMQFNETFIDLCAYPQSDYSYGVVKEFKGFIFRLLDRVRFKDLWSTFYVPLCKSYRLAVILLYEVFEDLALDELVQEGLFIISHLLMYNYLFLFSEPIAVFLRISRSSLRLLIDLHENTRSSFGILSSHILGLEEALVEKQSFGSVFHVLHV